MQPKIVETFLFSEPYESELLLLKFILANGYIDEFIICENAYSHQGDYIGHCANKIISSDERFAPFRNKVTVIEGNRQFQVIDKSKVEDHIAFICLNWQRDQGIEPFLSKYADDDWLIIHDVDEIFDFTDDKRRNEFFQKVAAAKDGWINCPRLRYWFDFDNQYKILYGSPMANKAFIKKQLEQGKTLGEIRGMIVFKPLNGWKTIPAFEYSSCYDKDHILRKLETTAHTGNSKSDLLMSLHCNHRTYRADIRKKKLRPTDHDFFETVKLTAKNSPLYVREHLQELKTNNVDSNYEMNRRKEYPEFYSLTGLMKLKLSDKLKESKKLLRKAKNSFR